MKKLSLYTLALAGGLTLGSCAESFLDQDNTYQQSPDNFFTSDDAVQAATSALYNYVWYDFNDKFSYGMGGGRANNITAQYSDYIYPYTNFTDNSLSQGLTEAWGSLYSVVAQSNNTINNINEKCTDAVTASAKLRAIAEARFMRGVAYWYIGTLWGCGILYDNTSSLVNNYVIPAQPRIDVISRNAYHLSMDRLALNSRVACKCSAVDYTNEHTSLMMADDCSYSELPMLIHSTKYVFRRLTVDDKAFDAMGPNEEFDG